MEREARNRHTRARTKTKYCVILDPKIVEIVREHGFHLSTVLQKLLERFVLELAGPNKAQVLLQVDPHFAECLRFAVRHRKQWDSEWGRKWWQDFAVKYGFTVEELKQLAEKLFGLPQTQW